MAPTIVAAQPDPPPNDARAELAEAQAQWREAVADAPPLVSLGPPPDYSLAGEKLAEMLKERLLLLGRKTFSNRQWRAYWARQQESAAALAELYAKLPNDAGKAAALSAWAALARDKLAIQDEYLQAIDTERDAVEGRRQALMDTQGAQVSEAEPRAADAVVAEPTPYEARDRRLLEIQERIYFHAERLSSAQEEVQLVQQQAESVILADKALRNDVALVRREREIAVAQAADADLEWAAIWRPIAEAAARKAVEVEEEVDLATLRKRSLDVEIELAKSQTVYRTQKLRQLEAQLELESSFASFVRAAGETAVQFVKARLWRIMIALLLIYLGVRVGVWLVGVGVGFFRKTAVGADDDDQLAAQQKRVETIAAVFGPLATIAVYGIGLLVALDQLGVDTGPLLGSVAILGLAISFGSQNLVRDVVNGFFILVENQLRVGDVVEVSGRSGVVEGVNVRSTRLRGVDGTLHIIPNGEITSVANRTQTWSRAVVDCGVAYGTSVARLREVVTATCESFAADPEWAPKLLETPAYAGLTQLGESSIVFRIMGKTLPGEQWDVERELNKRLYEGLGTAGIEIPLPQRVVWHHDAGAVR